MILINAQENRSKKLGMFTRYVPLSIPISIGCLAAYLIEKGHQVKLWDDAIKILEDKDLVELVKDQNRPYVFGISCLTASIFRGYELSKKIKTLFPESFVVLGGMHPTVLPDEALAKTEVDFVIREEGEIPLEQLYKAIKNNQSYDNIPNLSFKKNNQIVHNPSMKSPGIDSLPPFPYHLFEKHIDKYDFGFVISSRGCPYNCIFCSQRCITGQRFSYRSAEKVANDIELLVDKYGQKSIVFTDDNTLTDKKRIKELCQILIHKGLNKKVALNCQMRGDDVSENILIDLKSANFRSLNFGLETASERLMTLIDKKETVKQNIEALKLAQKHKFTLFGTFILGLPTETKQDRYDCFKLAKQFLDYVRFNNATPYPGTKLYEMAKQEKRLNVGKRWENLNACGTLIEGPFSKNRLAYVPTGTTELELKTDVLKYNLLFSLRWKVFGRLLSRKVTTPGWFKMPKNWFLNYKEWINLLLLGLKLFWLIISLFIAMSICSIHRLFKSSKQTKNKKTHRI